MNPILAVFFIILVSGAAFTLRGTWGHQIGGWVMGVSLGTGTGVVLGIDMATTVTLSFVLAVAWAAASFIGWAGRGTAQQFLRGCLAYGALPGLMLAVTLLPLSPAAWLLAASMTGLPTGLAFAMSVPLMHRIEAWRGSNTATSAWRYGMEYPAGLLHGAGIAAFLAAARAWFLPAGGLASTEWAWYHVLLAAVAIGGVVPACGWKGIIHRGASAGRSFRLTILAMVACYLVLSFVLIATGSVVGLFCIHLVSAGMVGTLYDKHVSHGEKCDVAAAWIAIIASITLASIA
ncbi:MAG: hypothetical protein GYA24_20850 [Candidatus Lokiarchaeota archaeon]|nr:hypothetical protein [Candidatus Lokiarchaeota archaeon]